MTSGRPSRNDDATPVRLESRHGPDVRTVVILLASVAVVGVFGRLVPGAGPLPARSAPAASAGFPRDDRIRLVSPIPGVVALRSTELAVRGVAPAQIGGLEIAVRAAGRSIGELAVEVAPDGRFEVVVPIVPPALRTAAVLEVREVGGLMPIATVAFPVEAGSPVLIRDPSRLAGRAGGMLVLDVLVYRRVAGLRALLTGTDGSLITTGSAAGEVGPLDPGDGANDAIEPRTVALELSIPDGPLPPRARLHLLAFGPDDSEVAHIDANVRLSGR